MRNPCCEKQDVNKGAWSKQEDQKLLDYVMKHGEGCWRTLPQAAGLLRCGKSCRLRWINYLRPELKKGNFAEDEEDLIIKLHALLGNRWSLIAGRLPGRTDNQVKNYWNSHLRKKLINMGIDPNNHRLRNPPIMPGSSASSHGLQDNAKNNESTKLHGDMEDESFCLPDLNSDISVSNHFPSSSHPPPPIIAQENHNPIHETSETSSEMKLASSPTLLLFR